jgi:hypothetical protein
MAKKDFKSAAATRFMSTGTQELQQAHEPHDPHEPHDEQEPHEVEQLQVSEAASHTRPATSPTTQGRKGMRLPRINMAFSVENLEYLNLVGRLDGISSTAYVNRLIDADREIRKADIEAAKRLLKGGRS